MEAPVKPEHDNYLSVIAGLVFLFVIAGLDPNIQRSQERATLVRG